MATSNPASDIAKNPPVRSAVSVAEPADDLRNTILPYGVAILVQLPLLILYYTSLWGKAHYSSWCLFAVLATAGLIWIRWPKDGKQIFRDSLWSNILLVVGLVSGLAGVLFVEPWFAACSIFTLLASLLARTIDRETGRSLWVVVLPLFVSLQLPMGWDRWLITTLQSTSAHLTSRLLDLVNIAHYMPGTVIQVPDKEYGIEEACSGIQSFFLLVFVAVVLCVWLRRSLFRSALLVIAAVIWSVFMNCVRIFVIPVFDFKMDIDLSHGVQHDLLGWSTMAMGIVLLLSTDQFLMFLFGPVDPGVGATGPLGKFITNIWNNIVSGKKEDEDKSKRRRSRRKPLTPVSRGLAWTTAAILTLGGLLALWDIKNCYAAPENATVNFFSSRVMYPLNENSLPEKVKDWKLVKYMSDERTRSSDLGQKSDSWIYQSPNRFYAQVSLDQTFPGWHELTVCYKNQGWKQVDRQRKEWEEADSTDEEKKLWPYIEAEFEKETGERGILLFSLFDGFGDAFDPPREWGSLAHLVNGAAGRLGHRVRARLFQGQAYQTQIFVAGYGEFSKEHRDEITDRYLKIREIMRSEFIATKKAAQEE